MKDGYIKTKPRTVVDIAKIVTIHYYEFDSSFRFDGERHDFWEMVYVDKGNVAVKCEDDSEIVLCQGEVIFHKPNEFHAIRSYESSPNFFVFSFVSSSPSMVHFEKFWSTLDRSRKGILSNIIEEAEKSYYISKNDPTLKKLLRRKDAPLGSEQLIKNYFELLLISFLRTLEENTKTPLPVNNETEPMISAIKDYIRARCEENIRIEEICSAFGYSKSFLSRFFKSRTGESLHAFAEKMKMRRAKELLRETGLNITQISSQLSFENPQYFARAFKRSFSMTPSEWRNMAHVPESEKRKDNEPSGKEKI